MRNLAAWLVFACAAHAQMGPHLLAFVSAADNTEQPYAVYLPPDFDAAKTYPLVVSLHSEESTHRLNFRQLFGTTAPFNRVDPLDPRFYPVSRNVEFIVAFPFARGTMGYQGVVESDMYEMLADVESRFRIDRDRVYLTGISMGGGGALWYALTRPDIWAAVAVLAPVTPPAANALAVNAFDLPVRLYQGADDPVVAAESSREWQRRLENAGVPVRYFEYPGVRHDIWNVAYTNGALFDWFARVKRNRYPERVRFAAESYRYNSAYWVRIDGLTPGTPAFIEAQASGTAVVVKTKNVDGFTLTPERKPTAVTIDGAALRIKSGQPLSFLRVRGEWRAGRFVPTGKRAESEGPIAAAFAGRQIYIYGNDNQALAERAAKWPAVGGAGSKASFRALADSAVTAADLADSDVVLFGTAQTNSLIARFAAQFPLALNPGAADYGLLFIAPVGAHYAVVSSGLPWWTGATEANRGGDKFAPEPYRLLSTLGDYVLFKGSLCNVVAEGRFDANWRVPAEAAAKMRATGTVTVK